MMKQDPLVNATVDWMKQTPFCITVDFDTIESNMVTIRHRDMSQERIPSGKVAYAIKDGMKGWKRVLKILKLY